LCLCIFTRGNVIATPAAGNSRSWTSKPKRSDFTKTV
jgi:hypothetical protein